MDTVVKICPECNRGKVKGDNKYCGLCTTVIRNKIRKMQQDEMRFIYIRGVKVEVK